MKYLLALLPHVLDWLYDKIMPVAIEFFRRMKKVDELEERQKARERQAEIVEKLRLEILRLRSENLPIPPEMEKRFHEEAFKLRTM